MNWFILAFISAIFSAASAVLEKKSLFSLDALNFSFLVSVVTLLFSIPFFCMIQYNDIVSVSMLILFIKTILSAAAFLYVMLSLKNLRISEALPLLALSPGLVAVAGFFFINDSLKWIEWSGILLMVIGTYILEMKKNPGSPSYRFSKYSYVIIALILFTVTSLLDRVLLKGYKLPPYKFMAFQQLFYALIFTIAVLSRSIVNRFRPKDIIKLPEQQAGRISSFFTKDLTLKTFYLIILVAAFTVIYRYTQIEATKLVPAALVLSVKRLSVLMAVIFGGKLFSEENLFQRVIAVIIILIGATMLMGE